MPYPLPRRPSEQDAYNRDMQERFAATHRVAPYAPQPLEPSTDPISQLKELAQLHTDGGLTDDEFAAFKAKLLGAADTAT
jgi:hypothetical protein